ncbi:MAG: helix-turn-helix domain-containing protein [Eubacteriales bacterium]
MQIGAFAKLCDTKISVLRHYDREGLLAPDYVDPFTGYRYYAKEQLSVFMRITALKRAGFSLPEIRQMLASLDSDEQLLALFQSKRRALLQTISDLAEAEKMIMSEKRSMCVQFFEKDNRLFAKSTEFSAQLQNEKREEMEKELLRSGYQRISGYRVMGEPMSEQVYLICDAVKLTETAVCLNDDTDIAFEDDPSVVGKWQTVGEYAVKEDFYGNICKNDYPAKEIFFLPNGQPYWCYKWSKGKLICTFGDASSVNPYTVETWQGSRYMFVSMKSYEYRHGGKPTVLVLRQLDHTAYTADALARKDAVDLPFDEDPDVLGAWVVKGFCRNIEAFDAEKDTDLQSGTRFFRRIVFSAGGEVTSVYGDTVISGANMQTWTKGYVLRKWNHTACTYRIRVIDDRAYLFVAWKSGDYIYGGMEPHYYVFVRETENETV